MNKVTAQIFKLVCMLMVYVTLDIFVVNTSLANTRHDLFFTNLESNLQNFCSINRHISTGKPLSVRFWFRKI